MARKLRLEYPRACYHVINRGNYRADIFKPEGAQVVGLLRRQGGPAITLCDELTEILKT